jgi:hypothetical protein
MTKGMTRFMLIVFGAALAGCASGPAFQEYPETEIERSPVLPEGVSAWKPFLARSQDSDGHAFFYPAVWEQGYGGGSFSLTWMPLPFAFKALLAGDGRDEWVAAEVSVLGALFTRDREFDWRPAVELMARKRVAPDWALEAGLLGQFEVRRVRQENYGLTAGLRAGAHWQASRAFWVRPSLWLWLERGETRASYLGRVPDSYKGGAVLPPRLRMPIQLELGVSVHRQWDVSLRMAFFSVGYDAGYFSAPGYLSVTHFW